MEVKKISKNIWEIEKTGEMKVPVRIYASEKLLEAIKKDDALIQAMNVAKLPGIQKYSYVLPDAHRGYGYPIGGVAAFDVDKGVISPGGVGYDINCSVRLLKTNLTLKDIEDKKEKVIEALFRKVPSGVGRGSKFQMDKKELDNVLKGGAEWAVKKGFGVKEDYELTEEGGKLGWAEPKFVSDKAKKRGLGQLGSLGAGNHFLEVQVVDEIYDKEVAEKFGLKKGMVTIMIHCGSRGLGHQVASDYIKEMEEKNGFPEYDRELVNAPIKSESGERYLGAMAAAANYAFANKQLITHWIREEMKYLFPNTRKPKVSGATKSKTAPSRRDGEDFEGFTADVVYDICHNIAKFEKYDGKELLVTRKGATRAFGPSRKELPKKYQGVGQPIIIPGSMGTASYVLVGTDEADELSFSSTAHGAGRAMSRHEALGKFKGEEIKSELGKKGIEVKAGSWKGLAEEGPQSYKDIDEVVKVSDEVGIGKLVVRVRPIAVMKG
ncbi:MAG: RtcB family protein [Nanoarchaeota archaeon]|nr:RtcB family protein [Nanoarchaeota archaeon]